MFLFFLIWGSFLNVIAYRIIRGFSIITPRSFCPSCKYTLAWFDLIPLFSFIWLKGSCRNCNHAIAWLYPFIELLSAITLWALIITQPSQFWLAYFIFFSALIVTIRTDLETMLISRYMSLFIVPLGWFFAALELLPLSLTMSILGTFFGYGFLWAIAWLFKTITGKEGMGQGDIELLAFIGAFTGILGCWISLMMGSLLGALYGISCILLAKKKVTKQTPIPFGPFLALAALLFCLLRNAYLLFLLCNTYLLFLLCNAYVDKLISGL